MSIAICTVCGKKICAERTPDSCKQAVCQGVIILSYGIKMSHASSGGEQISKQAASIAADSLQRQEEVLPMAKLGQRRYNVIVCI